MKPLDESMLVPLSMPLLLVLGDDGIPLLLLTLSLLTLLRPRPPDPGLPPSCITSFFRASIPLIRARKRQPPGFRVQQERRAQVW